jgi:hypothetical protein
VAAGSSIPLNNVIKNSDVALAGGVIGMLLIMWFHYQKLSLI